MPLNDKAGLMKNLPHRLKKHCGAFFLLAYLSRRYYRSGKYLRAAL